MTDRPIIVGGPGSTDVSHAALLHAASRGMGPEVVTAGPVAGPPSGMVVGRIVLPPSSPSVGGLAPTDMRQSFRHVEIPLPKDFYVKLEALRAKYAPTLTLPDFAAQLLDMAAKGYEDAMVAVEQRSRLVQLP